MPADLPAVLLTVNLDDAPWGGTYAADLEELRRTGVLRRSWPVGGPADVVPAVLPGADVWFVSVRDDGTRPGLLGHGILAGLVSGNPEFGGRPRELGRSTSDTFMLIDVDVLLPRGDEVPADAELERHRLLDGVSGGGARGTTAHVLTTDADLALRSRWSARARPDAGSSAPPPGVLPSMAIRRGTDNRFEVDQEVRRAVLAHHGSACHACGLDGEETYGPDGAGLMQVHLITPSVLIAADFLPDPLVDLVPLCPSCHVVVHSGAPEPFTVPQVRSMLRSYGFLRGAVLTEHQLEAEDAAERILEAGGRPGSSNVPGG